MLSVVVMVVEHAEPLSASRVGLAYAGIKPQSPAAVMAGPLEGMTGKDIAGWTAALKAEVEQRIEAQRLPRERPPSDRLV